MSYDKGLAKLVSDLREDETAGTGAECPHEEASELVKLTH